MAIISEMPSEAIIGRLRGTLDFYQWCNLCIVRTWPRSPSRTRSIPCALAGQQFAYINKQASSLPPDLIQAYKSLATGTHMTWKDWATRLYTNASYNLHESQA
jgi:hypothetical protein